MPAPRTLRTLRTLAWTLPALLLTAAQALLAPSAGAAAPSASDLGREICTLQDARNAAAEPLKSQAPQAAAPELADTRPLSVQDLVNLHVHETPVGITRSIAVCAAPGALPVQQPAAPASRARGRS